MKKLELFRLWGIKKLAVFTDRGVREAGLLEEVLETLEELGTEVSVIDNIPAEPSYLEVQEAADEFFALKAEGIVAVGGGSVMDTAKLVSILPQKAISVKELLDRPSAGKKRIKTIMIPTTAGTGAEATPNSVVAVPEKELKVGIVNEEMIADGVILDGAMLKSLPKHVAAASGIDALAHALECYTSKKATPFSDLYALEALKLIHGNLVQACEDQDAQEAKQAMLLAAFYGGVAITASGTTAVHALSYPLGGRYHIPHGTANAMLLGPVMNYNEPCIRPRLANVYDRLWEGGRAEMETEKSAEVLRWLAEIIRRLEIPEHLSAYGIGKGDLDSLVDAGLSVRRLLDNNRRDISAEAAAKIYLEIM